VSASNRGYSARAAIDAARRMEPASLLWIEEQVAIEDIAGAGGCICGFELAASQLAPWLTAQRSQR
jgi:hypothetical protein